MNHVNNVFRYDSSHKQQIKQDTCGITDLKPVFGLVSSCCLYAIDFITSQSKWIIMADIPLGFYILGTHAGGMRVYKTHKVKMY